MSYNSRGTAAGPSQPDKIAVRRACATTMYDDCRSSKSSSGRRMADVVLQVAVERRHETPSGMEALAACSEYTTAVRLGQEQDIRAGDGGGAEIPGRDRAALCPPMKEGER